MIRMDGRYYTVVSRQLPGSRPKLITHLLMHVQKSAIDQNVAAEVLKRIRARMGRVPGPIPENFAAQHVQLEFESSEAAATIGRVAEDFFSIIDDTRARSGARTNRHMQLCSVKNFTDYDFETIAANFEISARDAREIIWLYQSCFDGQGSFIRSAFEKNVSRFACHEKKIFEILWKFLKETPRRNNRLPFLNSLQLLVAETKKPIQSIKVLLADFTRNPESVHYPDRNAVMLLNQLLRAYNKEVIIDIEITPEEVLLVKSGLAKNVVNYVAWKVDGQHKTFQKKMGTIHERLLDALDRDLSQEPPLPIRFLLALQREVHIFLALVGGGTAVGVMRSELDIYGNPASPVYHLKHSPGQRETLLSHLAALIRGFGRLGLQSDLSLLDEVKRQQDQFMSLSSNIRYQALVRRVMGLIDATRPAIDARNN